MNAVGITSRLSRRFACTVLPPRRGVVRAVTCPIAAHVKPLTIGSLTRGLHRMHVRGSSGRYEPRNHANCGQRSASTWARQSIPGKLTRSPFSCPHFRHSSCFSLSLARNGLGRPGALGARCPEYRHHLESGRACTSECDRTLIDPERRARLLRIRPAGGYGADAARCRALFVVRHELGLTRGRCEPRQRGRPRLLTSIQGTRYFVR